MKLAKVTNQKKWEILIYYLKLYLSKHALRMKPVMISIRNPLEPKKNISYKEFQSIIKFIERELTFKDYKKDTR